MVPIAVSLGDEIYGVSDPENAGWGNKVHPSGGTALARLVANRVAALLHLRHELQLALVFIGHAG